jgi:hypothetical protein
VSAVGLIPAAPRPSDWTEFANAMTQQAVSANRGDGLEQLITVVPSTLGDSALRVFVAAGLIIAAIWRRSPAVGYVASVNAVPTLWLARLSALVAVPRLVRRGHYGTPEATLLGFTCQARAESGSMCD